MATRERRGGIGGISLGGIIVILGIVLMFVWSVWVGIVVLLIGFIAFGGFARGGGTDAAHRIARPLISDAGGL